MSKRRGFTLVEVLIVVVLVGILATIGTVALRRYINASKTVEATHNIGGIAASQQAVKAESGTYLNVSGALDHLYPAATPGTFKTAWGGPCTDCLRPWSSLTFRPDAPVSFGYATVASQSAVPPQLVTGGGGLGGGGASFFKAPSPTDPTSRPDPENEGQYLPDATGPYFTVVARGDTDGNGVFASALYYSETNMVVFDMAGE